MSGFEVELSEVSKHYRIGGEELRALDRVTLRIAAGEAVAVMGPSGSGKSTLLHLVGAMDAADQGQIRVDGFQVERLSRREQTAYRRRIGFVFQRFHLVPTLTALHNVASPVLPRRVDFDKFARARELLAAVGLAEKEAQLPSRLSGGEQQRVAIARALINQPGLLLADEPTGNLDTDTGQEIVQLLLRLRDQHGTTILIATHDAAVAGRSDRNIHLRDGKLIDAGLDEAGERPPLPSSRR